jgi:hypothetical protein
MTAFVENADVLPSALFGDLERAEAFRARLEAINETDTLGFDWDVETGDHGGSELWLHNDESIDMEMAVEVCRILLELDENDAVYTAEWADTCSSPRIGEFGGGAVAFSRHGAEWMATGNVVRELTAKLKGRGGVNG